MAVANNYGICNVQVPMYICLFVLCMCQFTPLVNNNMQYNFNTADTSIIMQIMQITQMAVFEWHNKRCVM